ncbi:MAG: isoprenylcysteine carboxylmethyltransferase family protein [Ruminococcus sp.]|nr:isoprenylcysteine carboxylmethyltransferase family protein [Ruminococcus sp.]
MIWQILGVLIMIGFYGIYIGKLLMQRRKGIQTDQIGKGGKKGQLYYTELVMKLASYSVILAELVSIFGNFSMLGTPVRCVGLFFSIAGIAVFGTAVWTMRDSWRAGIPTEDKTEMVTEGIYSISRNPAFLGFDLIFLGLVLMFFSFWHLFFALFAGVMLHLQILQEEKHLAAVFGEPYEAYRRQTGRYLGWKRNS